MPKADPVIVDFVVRGVRDVQNAFKSVQDYCTKSEQGATQATARGTSQRAGLQRRAGDQAEKNYRKVVAEAARWEREATKAAEKEARSRVKASEREANDKIKQAQRYAKEEEKVSSMLERVKYRAAQQAARSQAQEAAKLRRREERDQHEQTLRNRRFANAIVGGGAAGFSKAAGLGASAARFAAGTLLSLGGGFSIEQSLGNELANKEAAAKLVAGTDQTKLTDDQKIKKGTVLDRAKASATYLGEDTSEILEGISKFKDLTGNLGQAMDLSQGVGKISTAMGGDFSELMSVAGNLKAGDTENTMNNGQVLDVLKVLSAQGQKGAVEIKDFARYGSRIMAGASLNGGNESSQGRAHNVATMGAFAQIARQSGGAASAAEATLAAQRFNTDIAKKAGEIKENLGIDVSDGKGNLRDSGAILREMLVKTGGDVTKFGQTGLGERSVRVLTGAANVYKQAGGGKEGMEAFDKWMKGMVDSLPNDEQIDEGFRTIMSEPSKQLKIAVNELKQTFGEQLIPTVLALIPVLQQSIPAIRELLLGFTQLAQWILENPLKGAFAGLGLVLAGEIAKSGIQFALKEASAKMAESFGGAANASIVMAGALVLITSAVAGAFNVIDAFNKAHQTGEEEAANLAKDAKQGDVVDVARAEALKKESQESNLGLKKAGAEIGGTMQAIPLSPLWITKKLGVGPDYEKEAARLGRVQGIKDTAPVLDEGIRQGKNRQGQQETGKKEVSDFFAKAAAEGVKEGIKTGMSGAPPSAGAPPTDPKRVLSLADRSRGGGH